MSYFNKFPYLIDYQIQGKTHTGIDITRRTDIVDGIKNNQNAYIEYNVQDGETPEMLADRIYDEPGLYWVILMFNDIFNVHTQWPLGYLTLMSYIDRAYGEDKFSVHHYIAASTGAIVDADYPDYDRIPITNQEHEIAINDSKRSIKVPDPDIVPEVVQQHNRKIRQYS